MAILAVDDSRSSLALISKIASRLDSQLDCAVHTFVDPRQSLAFASRNDLDLAIVDYDMPHLDGVAVTSGLRALPRHHNLPVVMITSNEEASVRLRALKAGVLDFLRKPFDEIELAVRLRNLLALRRSQKDIEQHARTLRAAVAEAVSTVAKREEEIILRLSRAAEFKDPDTGAHVVRMATYCRILAQCLKLDKQQIDTIYLAAYMHDIGKLGVPDRILYKQGPLDQDERRQIERHAAMGYSILSGSECGLLQVAAQIALSHHERWDGSGYPSRLAGEVIPLPGRIAALADVFDALTSERPYKEAWSAERACAYIAANSGTHFDPKCVAAFFAGWSEISEVLNTHRECTAV